jgi:hypothetical protein
MKNKKIKRENCKKTSESCVCAWGKRYFAGHRAAFGKGKAAAEGDEPSAAAVVKSVFLNEREQLHLQEKTSSRR